MYDREAVSEGRRIARLDSNTSAYVVASGSGELCMCIRNETRV